jgi:two-component system, NarL family, response regulator
VRSSLTRIIGLTTLADHDAQEALAPLEVRVLRLIANGHTNKEIGAQLSMSEETIKSQVRSILSKLATDDRTHAVVIGLKRGIIDV